VLNSFNIETAELQLINAVSQLKSAQISDLILDLRYNGGGYLGISGVLGTMIAGNKANGEIFESTVYNDKYTQYDPIYGN
jgi:C-terminal processing protease CtpA/Prc